MRIFTDAVLAVFHSYHYCANAFEEVEKFTADGIDYCNCPFYTLHSYSISITAEKVVYQDNSNVTKKTVKDNLKFVHKKAY